MEPRLRETPFESRRSAVAGANGYLGTLVVASLLRDTAAQVLCLVRPGCDTAALRAAIAAAWEQQSRGRWSAAIERRIEVLTVPADKSDIDELLPALAGCEEIVHCAGCVDFQDRARLREANLNYTAHLLRLARRLRVRRFVYLSSAFSGGLRAQPIEEARLCEPAADPTPYTHSKRAAERLVAAAGVPFLILRPSIVIGRSDDGSYGGKPHGLVQQWASLALLAGEQPHEEFHAVASDSAMHLLHEDAFCAAFKAARRWLPDSAHMNLVADAAQAPTLRKLWQLWFEATRQRRVRWHASLDEVPLRRIPPRQRAYLTFARVSLRIALHPWAFETRWMDLLRARGLRFADATAASVRRCQDRFQASARWARASAATAAPALAAAGGARPELAAPRRRRA